MTADTFIAVLRLFVVIEWVGLLLHVEVWSEYSLLYAGFCRFSVPPTK